MSEFEAIFENGARAEDVVAIIGKTEGTALVDDYNRELADLRFREVIAERLGVSRDDVSERVAIVLSGGVFGVLTPHVTVITREYIEDPPVDSSRDKRLVVGRAFSAPLLGEDIGRMTEVQKVAVAVREAQQEASIDDPADVHSVIVKGPTLSRDLVDDAHARGQDVVTTDLGAGEYGAFCYANDAAALGVALALGEVPEGALRDDVVRRDWNLYSEVASTSAAPDKVRAEVLVLGNSMAGVGDLRIGHGTTKDLLDTSGVKEALRSAGLTFDCCPSPADLERVVQIFAKLIIPQDGRARGNRTTLLDDIEAAKTTKAVGSVLVGSVIGRTSFYMSGGERNSHQGPPGGSPVAAVIRV
jgi:cyanuric acid amidohydrolase